MQFQQNRDGAFQNFMNEQSMTPDFLANYTDYEMTTGLKGADAATGEQKLTAIIELFRHLHQKDSYLSVYQGCLADRLINKTELSRE